MNESLRCDALIVGAGITGALMAERLTRQGLDVVIIDRETPGRGSTSASTAMLLWEIDKSLGELTDRLGYERAVRAYRASLDAALGLQSLVEHLELSCDMRRQSSLLLAADADSASLRHEHALRERAGLPGTFLDHGMLLDAFEIARAGAIISSGSADADPVKLTNSLLTLAQLRSAKLLAAEATTYDAGPKSVGIALANGIEIEAKHVMLATGYVMPDFIDATIQTTQSSWAIATHSQPDRLWRDDVLIWEDSDDYLYARTTADGRIIIGGEDDPDIIEPEARDAAIPAKARALQHKLQALWPAARTTINDAWSGVFDTTADGLPLIGPVPAHPNMFAAYGYGGNGITFSYMAAQLIGDLLAGKTSPLLTDFAIDRD